MPVELTADLDHESIVQVVDQIISDRQGTEDKSDARRLAEDRDEPVGDMTAEADSGSKDTVDDEKTGEQDWLDADLKAEVAAYGIGEEELAEFTSREELERALRFFDRSALEAGRKALAEGETRGRDEHGRFQKKESESEAESDERPSGGYEITLDRDIYNEDLVDELTHMRDHYESRVAAIEARFAEADARAEEQQFDNLVDSLGLTDLFGKSGKETAKELQRRQDLFVAAKAQRIGLKQLGRPVDLDESLLSRVARMVFAEEISKKELKARTSKLTKQSNSRMGGSAAKARDPGEPLMDEMRRLYKELEDAG